VVAAAADEVARAPPHFCLLARGIAGFPSGPLVLASHDDQDRFNGFHHASETVETVSTFTPSLITQLKQGVNDVLSESVGTM
jgi:hypothetical protein